MPSLIDIRRRVRAVKSTQQITKAMKMVSSSKLRRAQQAVEVARPYAERIETVLGNIAASVAGALASPLVVACRVISGRSLVSIQTWTWWTSRTSGTAPGRSRRSSPTSSHSRRHSSRTCPDFRTTRQPRRALRPGRLAVRSGAARAGPARALIRTAAPRGPAPAARGSPRAPARRRRRCPGRRC